jgi:hypothetical protein
MPAKSHVLRAIAASSLDKAIPRLASDAREELTTSIIRQWLTYDGHAGVFTLPIHYWFHLEQEDGEVRVGTEVVPGSLVKLLTPWRVLDDDLPEILWQLSVAQNATFVNADGLTVRVRADAKEHGFGVQEVVDENELEP